jgi:tubulin epsilon
VLCLANTCAIADKFDEIGGRFQRLFRARAHLHHYTEYLDAAEIGAAGDSLAGLAAEYRRLERGAPEESGQSNRIRVL